MECAGADIAPTHLGDLYDSISGQSLVLLLAHGDPAQAAALLTAMAKAALWHTAAAGGEVDAACSLAWAAVLVANDPLVDMREGGMGQQQGADAGSPDAATAGAGAKDAAAVASSCPATQQQLRLLSFALSSVTRWRRGKVTAVISRPPAALCRPL